MITTDDWILWAWVAVVAAAVLASVLARRLRPALLPILPLRHVAGATQVAVIGWQALLNLPGAVLQFFSAFAGIEGPTGESAYEAFVVAACVFVAASAVAVVAILRRRPWGAVLGIGVCVAHIGTSLLGVANMLSVIGDFGDDPNMRWYVITFALSAIPAVVGIVLLALPLFGQDRAPAAVAAYRGDPDSEVRDGIIDADSEAAGAVEWPDWKSPPEPGR
jgi:hypothetical protein